MAFKLDPKDLRVETMRGHGNGGQNRNKTESAVRITHVPTGISEFCQDQRQQLDNKRVALERLTRRLELIYHHARKVRTLELFPRNESVIKTYNFQRGTVKDHRTGRVADLTETLNGKIDI